MLSKKHYKAIAYILKVTKSKKEVARQLALYFKNDNVKFSLVKFFVACGIYKGDLKKLTKAK